MEETRTRRRRPGTLVLPVAAALVAIAVPGIAGGATQGSLSPKAPAPTFSGPKAFDISPPLRELANSTRRSAPTVRASQRFSSERELSFDWGAVSARSPWAPAWLAASAAPTKAVQSDGPSIAGPRVSFEGLSNQDNFNIFGFRVNPPDPVGDVGPNHYVEMVNLVFGVYSKTGTLLLGPVDTGALWAGFPIDECTDPSGDPIVIYDQFADRWILTQFTTRGIDYPNEPLNLFYNCVAISTTGDPTGSYYRYAFSTGYNFPDYPKYGVWRDHYLITTREFGILDPSIYGIGVYGLERNRMIAGDPNARVVSFLLKEGEVPLNLIGDGLLPADMDGNTKPTQENRKAAPIIGTQDDDAPYGATFDALNIWEFAGKWGTTPTASLVLKTQLPVAEFDSNFPCGVVAGSQPPSARDCLPQPGITDGSQYLDILSYRQRPTWRLAYRNFPGHEALVTNQSVEALPGIAGVRWYEIRRQDRKYTIYQQGDYAPSDGVHRWMGSVAMDKFGNIALGYSVVNGTDVYPGIRYTGRKAGDPLGQMTLGEGVIMNGTGVQTSVNSRWGDYTSLNINPIGDCEFWYVNEYYTAAGQASSPAGWQTRIASFRLPGCV